MNEQAAPSLASNAESARLPGGAFRLLPTTTRLLVPIVGTTPDQIDPLPPGTRLRRGQFMARAWPEQSAAPLAPVDGVVGALTTARLSTTMSWPAVPLDPVSPVTGAPGDTSASLGDAPASPGDGGASNPPTASPASIDAMLQKLAGLSLAEGITQLAKLGVHGDRWSSPDLLAQLRLCVRKPIDTLICDALDETPDLLLHNELTSVFAVEIVAGVLALAALCRAQRVLTVMPAYGQARGLDAMRSASAGGLPRLVALADHYPQSHSSLLIHEMTGRHCRPGVLPPEKGVLVLNAATALAVGRCFLLDEPMLDVPIGLRLRQIDQTHWLRVAIGTPWSVVLESAGLWTTGLSLRGGNPIREHTLDPSCVIGGGELAVTASLEERAGNPDPCIRCAWCVEGCPVRIQPAGLLEAAQQQDAYLADRFGLDACVECGICNYVCPAHLPILQGIRALRQGRRVKRKE